MKLQFKFNPALRRQLAAGDRRRWLFRSIGLRVEPHAVPIWTFEIYWRRLLLGGLVLAVASYFILATALFAWLSRNRHNQVGWLDLVTAPVRWENLRTKRGETSIATAFAKFKEGDYVEGFYGLRVGLSRSPGNVTARTTLARLFAASDPAQTIQTLEVGLRYSAHDVAFLRALFAQYAHYQAAGRALEQTALLLEPGRSPALPPAARHFVTVTRAGLLLERGDPAGAEQLLAALPADGDGAENLRARRLRMEALGQLGRADEAVALARQALNTASTDPAELRAEAELAIARSDSTALDSALRRLKATASDAPTHYLYAFQAWHRLRRHTLRDTAEQEFYRVFGSNDAAMQLFAATAVNLDLPEAVHRAMQVAQRHRLSTFAFRVHLTEIALRRGDFDLAFRLAREWERTVDSLNAVQRAYPEFVSRLARACVAGGEQQQAGLLNHLGTMRGRAGPGLYQLAAESLERAGQLESARTAVQLGLRFYPHTDGLNRAQTRLVALAADAAAAAERARPVVVAVELPATGAEALERLDADLAAESYLAVREFVRVLRAGRPAWLERFEPELSLRELEAALHTQEASSSRALVRAHLDRYRSDDDAMRLVRLAEALLRRDRTKEARIVHDEVAALRGGVTSVAFALRGLNLTDELAATATSAAAALEALDGALARRQAAEALRVLDYVRQRAPAWLGEARNDLLVREIRIRLALDQRPLAFAALRDLTLRAGVPRAAAFRLVRDLHAGGEEDRAVMLAREIVRLLPGDAAAARLLKDVQAPRPTE